jgi:hypothetical protein
MKDLLIFCVGYGFAMLVWLTFPETQTKNIPINYNDSPRLYPVTIIYYNQRADKFRVYNSVNKWCEVNNVELYMTFKEDTFSKSIIQYAR